MKEWNGEGDCLTTETIEKITSKREKEILQRLDPIAPRIKELNSKS